jgi:hypothetical protein
MLGFKPQKLGFNSQKLEFHSQKCKFHHQQWTLKHQWWNIEGSLGSPNREFQWIGAEVQSNRLVTNLLVVGHNSVIKWNIIWSIWFIHKSSIGPNRFIIFGFITELDDGKNCRNYPVFDGKNPSAFWLRFSLEIIHWIKPADIRNTTSIQQTCSKKWGDHSKKWELWSSQKWRLRIENMPNLLEPNMWTFQHEGIKHPTQKCQVNPTWTLLGSNMPGQTSNPNISGFFSVMFDLPMTLIPWGIPVSGTPGWSTPCRGLPGWSGTSTGEGGEFEGHPLPSGCRTACQTLGSIGWLINRGW